MEEELGLAQMAGQQQAQPMMDVGQIVALLKQGVDPQELLANGVPVELIREAMMMIQQEMTQVPAEQAGLAGMAVR